MIAIKRVVHHLLGPLQPAEHDVPQFAQMYIIDSMDAQVIARSFGCYGRCFASANFGGATANVA